MCLTKLAHSSRALFELCEGHLVENSSSQDSKMELWGGQRLFDHGTGRHADRWVIGGPPALPSVIVTKLLGCFGRFTGKIAQLTADVVEFFWGFL